MPKVQVYVSVPLPVDEVFWFLADGANLARWHSGVMAIRPDEPGGPIWGEGCTFQYRFPGRRRDCRLACCAYESGTRVGFLGQRMWTPLGTQSPRYDFRVWPQGSGCRVGVQVTCRLTGGLLALWPVVAMGWRRDLPEDVQRMHEVLTGTEEPAEIAFAPGLDSPGGVATRPRRLPRRLRQSVLNG